MIGWGVIFPPLPHNFVFHVCTLHMYLLSRQFDRINLNCCDNSIDCYSWYLYASISTPWYLYASISTPWYLYVYCILILVPLDICVLVLLPPDTVSIYFFLLILVLPPDIGTTPWYIHVHVWCCDPLRLCYKSKLCTHKEPYALYAIFFFLHMPNRLLHCW